MVVHRESFDTERTARVELFLNHGKASGRPASPDLGRKDPFSSRTLAPLTGRARKGRARRRNATAVNTSSSLALALREHFGLTQMEGVVASLLAEGLTYREVAARCRVSYHTTHTHVKAIHLKVGVSSNARLLALIRKEGWT